MKIATKKVKKLPHGKYKYEVRFVHHSAFPYNSETNEYSFCMPDFDPKKSMCGPARLDVKINNSAWLPKHKAKLLLTDPDDIVALMLYMPPGVKYKIYELVTA